MYVCPVPTPFDFRNLNYATIPDAVLASKTERTLAAGRAGGDGYLRERHFIIVPILRRHMQLLRWKMVRVAHALCRELSNRPNSIHLLHTLTELIFVLYSSLLALRVAQ